MSSPRKPKELPRGGFELYRDRAGEHRWRLWSRNGRAHGRARRAVATRHASNRCHPAQVAGARRRWERAMRCKACGKSYRSTPHRCDPLRPVTLAHFEAALRAFVTHAEVARLVERSEYQAEIEALTERIRVLEQAPPGGREMPPSTKGAHLPKRQQSVFERVFGPSLFL